MAISASPAKMLQSGNPGYYEGRSANMVRAATGPEATDDAIVLALVEKVSPRQRDVLQLTAKGLTNQEIGLVLGMSPETVRTHLSAIFARLHVSNRAEAAAAYAAWDASTKPWMGTPPHGRADASSTRVAEILSRPAIAILPMIALDHDPHTLPAAAGLSRDLVVLFSRWCWFPVIAHSSTRDVRALGDTNQEIGARLGARFLIDGSLRASSTTYRLNICVTDTLTGSVVWAQNFDFARYDLFVAQDQVCQAVVAAVYPCLVASVKETLPPFPHAADVDAWEVAHHAFTLHDRRDRESNQKAQAGFSIAIHRDPTLVLGHFGLGLSAFDIILNQWGPIGPEVDRLAGCADRCIELAPHMAEGYYLQARAQQSRGDPDRSIDLLEQAIGHNPSFALAHVLLPRCCSFRGGWRRVWCA